ncbi:MAG: YidC/Oxa1 family membrane protein insertase [Oscillospiraceae bacterium]|nr:YidC/Oxa1 family membrane protein insertase [Oscillospiraceae bacterium]
MELIATPLGWLMRRIYNFVGNYGVTLILFTLVTKIILMPLTVKQKKSMIRMNAFQPEIQRIQKKYATDTQKQQEELTRLQTEHNFSMTSGCLPMLIQMPILFGLIDVIYKPLRHIVGVNKNLIADTLTPMAEKMLGTLSRYSPQTDIIKAIKQAPEAFADVLDAATITTVQEMDLTFLGMDLSATPSLKVFNSLLLIPVLSVIFMLLQQYLTQKLNGQQSNGQTTAMLGMTTLMFGYFAFMMPAGVSIYWIFSSVFGILQELVLRIFIDPEKEKAKIEEEIYEARKARKEKEKQRPAKVAKAKEKAKDKYVADVYESEEEAERVRKRLEKARALDKEKYGD